MAGEEEAAVEQPAFDAGDGIGRAQDESVGGTNFDQAGRCPAVQVDAEDGPQDPGADWEQVVARAGGGGAGEDIAGAADDDFLVDVVPADGQFQELDAGDAQRRVGQQSVAALGGEDVEGAGVAAGGGGGASSVAHTWR
jgi:hypothetical protein